MVNNKRWFYLGIGTLLLVFCGLIYGWSLFKAPFSLVYPDWTISNLSMIFTISMVFFSLGGFVAGKMSARLKPQFIIRISAVLLLVGFLGVSRLDPTEPLKSLKMLYFFYGVLGGTGVGFSYNSIISTMNKWFIDKQGFASGIMLMGFGWGGMILGGIAMRLVSMTGIFNTFFVLGCTIFVVLFVGSLFIKLPEESQEKQHVGLSGIKPSEMIRKTSFWLFFSYSVVVGSAGLMVMNSAASIALAFGAPAIVGMIVSVFNGAGRVIIGGIFDKLGRKKTMLINIAILIVSGIILVWGAKSSSMVFVLLGLLSMGISYGGNPTISSSFYNSQYGPKYFSVNFSIGTFSLIPASFIGPLISSNLIEKANGFYDTTFMAIIVCAVLAFILWELLNLSCRKESGTK